MSTLQVANLHLESTGNNRVQFVGSSLAIVAGGANTVVANSTVTQLVAGGTTVLTANSTTTVAKTSDFIGQQTIWVPAAAMYARTTAGAAAGIVQTSNLIMLNTFNFDTTAAEHVQFAIQMPKSWNEGTLFFQFLWSHPATTTNFGVVWGVEATAFTNDDTLNTAWSAQFVTVADTGGTTDDLYITSETSALTVVGNPTAEEYVVFQIFRLVSDGSDTMAVDARLHGVKIHYTTDAGKDD
jgi:hypothetical protein